MVSGFNISGVVDVTAATISASSNPRSMEESVVGRYVDDDGVDNSSFYCISMDIHFGLCNNYYSLLTYTCLLGEDILRSANVCGGGLGLCFI